MFLQKTENCA